MNRKRVVLAVLLSATLGGLTTACSGSTPSAAPSAVTVTVTASAATPTGASQPSAPTATASPISQSNPSTTAAVPVLGTVWAPGVQGYGVAHPSGLDNHGDPTGIVDHLHWSTWGGATAHGTGNAEYVAPDQSVAQGTETQATVVAFNLGTCQGKPAYRAIEWYFPSHGQHFDATRYFDPCTGQDHGM